MRAMDIRMKRLVGALAFMERTRPLCTYPQFAVYKGTGDLNDAATVQCRAAST